MRAARPGVMQRWAVRIHDFVYGGMFLVLMGCEIILDCFSQEYNWRNITCVKRQKTYNVFFTT